MSEFTLLYLVISEHRSEKIDAIIHAVNPIWEFPEGTIKRNPNDLAFGPIAHNLTGEQKETFSEIREAVFKVNGNRLCKIRAEFMCIEHIPWEIYETDVSNKFMKTSCEQCGKSLGPEMFLGPVCGKCCRENHQRVANPGSIRSKRGSKK